jgi:hypothetical protein
MRSFGAKWRPMRPSKTVSESAINSGRSADELVTYHGGAKPGDQTFADIVAVNDGIIGYLAENKNE